MEEKLSDRAQAYWETISNGNVINAEELFDNSRRPKDLGEDIRHVRSFLTRKFNDGLAFLIPGQSPPTYEKLEKRPSVVKFCTMLFNSLPAGERITTLSLNNRLPLKMQNKKSVSNFLYRVKQGGATCHVLDENDRKLRDGKYYVVEKTAGIVDLPTVNVQIVKEALKMVEESESKKTKMIPEEMATKIFDMRASDVGMSIFELLHKLMKENEFQGESIKTLKEALHDSMESNKKLVSDYNANLLKMEEMKTELTERLSKDKTYGEIYRGDPVNS